MLNQPNITSEVLRSMTGAVARVIGQSHPSDVADCVQDAIVKVLSKIDTFDSARGEFKGWASTIAGNEARNWRKASANRGHDSEASIGNDESTETTDLVDTLIGTDGRAEVSRRTDLAWLARAVETLDDDSQIFVMGLADGMGLSEAGEVLGWSPATSTRRYKAIVADLAIEAEYQISR